MADTLFLYWKNPGKKEIFTIENPQVEKISKPELLEEGFIFIPYHKKQSGYLIKGKIVQVTDINFSKFNEEEAKIEFNRSYQNYNSIVSKAIKEIKNGNFNKVVLARSCFQKLPEHFNINTYFKRLCRNYPNAFINCISINNEIWIGATPEVLLIKEDNLFLTYALAGTKSLNPEEIFSNKEKDEQLFVKNYIIDILESVSAEDIEISKIREIDTGNLKHLINEIRFTSTHPIELINKMHPTPAVCGTPLKNASDFIDKNENLNREFYSGYLGPIYRNNDFSFWVNLRCAKIINNYMKLFAGAGISKDSLVEAEWQETENKMDTLRTLL